MSIERMPEGAAPHVPAGGPGADPTAVSPSVRLQMLGQSGVWAGYAASVAPGQRYKYKVQGADGAWTDRADPMAQRAQTPPDNASEIWVSDYQWGDDAWLKERTP